jgi:hypothetical protein
LTKRNLDEYKKIEILTNQNKRKHEAERERERKGGSARGWSSQGAEGLSVFSLAGVLVESFASAFGFAFPPVAVFGTVSVSVDGIVFVFTFVLGFCKLTSMPIDIK